MTTRTEPTPQPPIRLTFDGHGFNDAGDPYRRRFATLASYYTHPDRARGETDALCEFIVRAVNSHAALVEAAQLVLDRWERGDLAEAVRALSAALAAAKGTK